jgi:uncharacterized membrane protein
MVGWWLFGSLLAATSLQTWLSSPALAATVISPPTYAAVWSALMRTPVPGPDGADFSWPLAFALVSIAMLLTFAARVMLRRAFGSRDLLMAAREVGRGWTSLGLWEPVRLIGVMTGWTAWQTTLEGAIPLWIAAATAWGLTSAFRSTIIAEVPSASTAPVRRWAGLWIAAGVYSVVYVTMNWRLWFNLYLPHGDSAMYEEHLWNVLAGRGFRSALDQGLFLGEHIQFVHLGLLPVYWFCRSHLLLELCESLALASGVFPLALMTYRHTQSRRVATAAAVAYLLYFPLQFLDIEIDLKTFRPEAFGIPILLWTLERLDAGRMRGFLLGVLGCLTVKEDYAIILAPLGLWIVVHAFRRPEAVGLSGPVARWRAVGIGLTLFGPVYLWTATRVLIPWFRPGEEVHYTRYFSRLGDSPEAILQTFLFRPDIVAGEILTPSTMLYALALLVPFGLIPLLSPGRLSVGLPLFGVLCLNELARDPRHHFHAPLVAIVAWALAAGLGNWSRVAERMRWFTAETWSTRDASRWVLTSALATGCCFSLSPLGWPFWDPGSTWNWRTLYGPTDRGAAFAKLAPLIPLTAHVASTDFVHPRFTHHAGSYDYSGYLRKISGYERRVPEDTDFIVIDTSHRYSTIKTPAEIPEYHDHPELWELLPETAAGPFIVLRRRPTSAAKGP